MQSTRCSCLVRPMWCSGVALLTGRLQAGYMQVTGTLQAGYRQVRIWRTLQTVSVKACSMSGNAKSAASHNLALHHSSNLAYACTSSVLGLTTHAKFTERTQLFTQSLLGISLSRIVMTSAVNTTPTFIPCARHTNSFHPQPTVAYSCVYVSARVQSQRAK